MAIIDTLAVVQQGLPFALWNKQNGHGWAAVFGVQGSGGRYWLEDHESGMGSVDVAWADTPEEAIRLAWETYQRNHKET